MIIQKKINENLTNLTKIKNEINGVCVFDLDDTLTCGLENAKNAIQQCKINNYKLAINTARTGKYCDDIKFEKLGIEKHEIEDDYYHGDEINFSNGGDKNLNIVIANKKVQNLNKIREKYDLQKNQIILFDDNHYNINLAKKEGYVVVHANGGNKNGCGIPEKLGNIFLG